MTMVYCNYKGCGYSNSDNMCEAKEIEVNDCGFCTGQKIEPNEEFTEEPKEPNNGY